MYPAPGEIEQNELDCLDTAPLTYLLFKETYGNDVCKLIKSLKSSKGCDLDGSPVNCYKKRHLNSNTIRNVYH